MSLTQNLEEALPLPVRVLLDRIVAAGGSFTFTLHYKKAVEALLLLEVPHDMQADVKGYIPTFLREQGYLLRNPVEVTAEKEISEWQFFPF